MDLEPWHEQLEGPLQYNQPKPPTLPVTRYLYADEQLRVGCSSLTPFGLVDLCESSLLDTSPIRRHIPAEGSGGTFLNTTSMSSPTPCSPVPMLLESQTQALLPSHHSTQKQTLSSYGGRKCCLGFEPQTACAPRSTDHASPSENTLAETGSDRHWTNSLRRGARPQSTGVVRCFDHGCDGRRFSSVGNLVRHRKEKDGLSRKFHCTWCGMSFTRSTARKQHQDLSKCPAQLVP